MQILDQGWVNRANDRRSESSRYRLIASLPPVYPLGPVVGKSLDHAPARATGTVARRAQRKHQAQLRNDLGEKLIEQRTAHQADDLLVKHQAVSGDRTPVFTLPSQGASIAFCMRSPWSWLSAPLWAMACKSKSATDDKQIPHLIPLQAADHHALIAHIARQPFLAQTVQRFTDGILRDAL